MLSAAPVSAGEAKAAAPKPLFRDFVGLCVHTVQFRPELYAPVCGLVRDYHGFNWDVGNDTDYVPQFPFARNRVNWEKLYGDWRRAGYRVDVSIMFGETPAESWKDLPRNARAYGLAFARFFGPSSARSLVEAVEIGNEPGHYDDATYRLLFENMARGLRDGDPELTIVTCAATTGESHKYAKSLTCLKGLEDLYDVINVHAYARAEPYPTWRSSFPEDPNIDHLEKLERIIAWRDANALGKQVWLTEFGWDATTRPAPQTGTFAKWIGVTDTQQAQYLVRSFLLFSSMDLDRAYIFFFNDNDQPRLFGSSGLTRNYQPKPAFHAVAHLRKTLGQYRFTGILTEEPGRLYVYEFTHGENPARRILAVWSPTGAGRSGVAEIPLGLAKLLRTEKMPLEPGPAPTADVRIDETTATVHFDESPLYLWLEDG